MSELKILHINNGLEIWKGDDDKFPFCRNDMAELKNCIEKVLSRDVDEYEFKRKDYGSFRLARDGDKFKLYGNLGYHYPCTESELKRLLKNVTKILEPATISQDDLTVDDLLRSDFVIISNSNDEEAAIKIQNKLDLQYQYKAIICNEIKWKKWHKRESKTLNRKPQISLGSGGYNKTTKYLEKNFAKEELSSFSDYIIKIGDKDLIIYGYETPEQTDRATDNFLNSRMLDYYIYCCRQFLGTFADNAGTETPTLKIEDFYQIIAKFNENDKSKAEFELIHSRINQKTSLWSLIKCQIFNSASCYF